jgi:hypothetical protein
VCEREREREREKLDGYSIIPSRYEKNVPIWKTKGIYRKEMKRGYTIRFYTIKETKR